jgi:hypothetical protein
MYPATRQVLIRGVMVFVPSVVALLLLRRGVVTLNRGTALTVAGIALGLGLLMLILLTIVESRGRNESTVVWSVAFLSAALLCFTVFGWMMYVQQVWLGLLGGAVLGGLVAAITAEVSARRRATPQRP